MSFCYDFEKWTIISLASIALTLTIGLVTLAYGQIYRFDPLVTKCVMYHDTKLIVLNLTCDESIKTIAYYTNQGYEIKAILMNQIMYMQKLP